MGDSLRYPMGKFSRYTDAYLRFTPPALDSARFQHQMLQAIQDHNIQLIIPTCEEALYVAQLKPLVEPDCHVFCSSHELLIKCHSKWDLLMMVAGLGVKAPKTKHVATPQDLFAAVAQLDRCVLKPEFTRFGVDTLINPKRLQVTQIKVSKSKPWLVQEYIEGREYCSYSIANHGKLVAHVEYEPRYRVGIGASVYFDCVQKLQLQNFVSEFVRRYGFHGQIGFDYICDQNNDCFILECNPRATSGMHFMGLRSDFSQLFTSTEVNNIQLEPVSSIPKHPLMLASAVLIFAAKRAIQSRGLSEFLRNYRRASDISFDVHDQGPFWTQFLSLGEVGLKSLKHRLTLREASTMDFEWNG
jgi:hypothetical protein